MANIEQNKAEFISLLKTVNREGIEKLINWLQGPNSDFFTAPATQSYHGNYPGGLCQHSLNVYYAAKHLLAMYKELSINTEKVESIKEESIIISSLLHDLYKTNYYTEDTKWYKDDNNAWQSYMGYEIDDKFPFGRGEKSVFMIQRFMNLTGPEALAIRWHMSNIDPGIMMYPLTKYIALDALSKIPLVGLIAMADMFAAFEMEAIINKKS